MRAVVVTEPGGPDVLQVQDVPDPAPGPGDVLIDVAASAVNRADLLQRQGHYPPPPGASHVLGLECSGRVAEVGEQVSGWSVGDEVCALLSGGGYATRVAVPAGQVLPVPRGLSVEQAAALPEVACTVWSMVFDSSGAGRLQPGETLLVHGGSSGIGTMAIQLAVALGSRVLVTVGSDAKADFCRSLGAEVAVNYRDEDFVARVRDAGGADVVLDNMGAAYLGRNIEVLKPDGRLVVLGMQGGRTGELDLGLLMAKRGTVHSAGLRARSAPDKARVVAATGEHVWPLVEQGAVRPVIDRVVPFEDAAAAHRAVDASEHIGKVLLRMT
jgi:putative PIG3 family NAD(P)H quinone oxidoreductase